MARIGYGWVKIGVFVGKRRASEHALLDGRVALLSGNLAML